MDGDGCAAQTRWPAAPVSQLVERAVPVSVRRLLPMVGIPRTDQISQGVCSLLIARWVGTESFAPFAVVFILYALAGHIGDSGLMLAILRTPKDSTPVRVIGPASIRSKRIDLCCAGPDRRSDRRPGWCCRRVWWRHAAPRTDRLLRSGGPPVARIYSQPGGRRGQRCGGAVGRHRAPGQVLRHLLTFAALLCAKQILRDRRSTISCRNLRHRRRAPSDALDLDWAGAHIPHRQR